MEGGKEEVSHVSWFLTWPHWCNSATQSLSPGCVVSRGLLKHRAFPKPLASTTQRGYLAWLMVLGSVLASWPHLQPAPTPPRFEPRCSGCHSCHSKLVPLAFPHLRFLILGPSISSLQLSCSQSASACPQLSPEVSLPSQAAFQG